MGRLGQLTGELETRRSAVAFVTAERAHLLEERVAVGRSIGLGLVRRRSHDRTGRSVSSFLLRSIGAGRHHFA